MSRKAKKISIDELKKVILEKVKKYDPELEFDFEEEFYLEEMLEAFPKVQKDISKIQFDLENYDIDPEGLAGFNKIGDLSYLGVIAGGDWEMPIFFILYLDHNKQLRGYVPTDGNVFNKPMKSAYGNNDEEDEREVKKLGFETYDDMDFDWNKIEEDIKNRIQII